MKKNTGFYPQVRVDTGPSPAVGQAGAVLLTDTIRVSGLDAGLAAALGPWRKPTAIHHRPRSCAIWPSRWRSAGTASPTSP